MTDVLRAGLRVRLDRICAWLSEQANAGKVASAVRASIGELVEETARDVESVVDFFVSDEEQRASILAEPFLAEVCEVSPRVFAGELLRGFAPYALLPGGPVQALERRPFPMPPAVDVSEVARWATPGIRLLNPERRWQHLSIPAGEVRDTDRVVTYDDLKAGADDCLIEAVNEERARGLLHVEREMDSADVLLHYAERERLLVSPVLPNPRAPGTRLFVMPSTLTWLYVAANAEHLAARAFLERQEGRGHAGSHRALELLRAAIRRRLPDARAALGLPLTRAELEAQGADKGPCALDDRLADHIRSLPVDEDDADKQVSTAEKSAEHARRAASNDKRAAWLRWLDPRWLAERLAVALWNGEVRPRLERQERWLSPALAAQVYDRVVDSTSRLALNADPIGDHLVDRTGKQLLLSLDAGAIVGALTRTGSIDYDRLRSLGQNGALLARGLELVGSYNSHRLVRAVPRACLEAKIANPDGDHRVLTFESYDQLADLAGFKGKRQQRTEDVRALAYVYDVFRVTLDDGSSDRLWMRGEYPRKRPGRIGRPPREITLTVSPLLLPHTQEKYLGDDARWLIPLVDVPPVVGTTYAGQQATLQLLVVGFMRARAPQLVKHGGVAISDEDWARMAVRADVPSTMLPAVQERWLRDGDDGPAFLGRAGPGYTLAPAHADALEFLCRGGRMTLAGRKGAKITKALRKKRRGV